MITYHWSVYSVIAWSLWSLIVDRWSHDYWARDPSVVGFMVLDMHSIKIFIVVVFCCLTLSKLSVDCDIFILGILVFAGSSSYYCNSCMKWFPNISVVYLCWSADHGRYVSAVILLCLTKCVNVLDGDFANFSQPDIDLPRKCVF